MKQNFRSFAMLLLCFCLTGISMAQVTALNFDKDSEGFAIIAGKGTITQETTTPINGAGSLRLTLDNAVSNMRVASTTLEVKPWTIYSITDKHTVSAGMEMQLILQFADGEKWRDVIPTSDGDGYSFGTLLITKKVRVVYNIHATDKAIDRFVLIDAISVITKCEIVKDAGVNLFSDPSFEAGTIAPPEGWSNWVNKPDKSEIGNRDAHEGKQYYSVSGKGSYIVLPLIEVKPNHLYRIHYWVRGEGKITFGMHKLAPNTPNKPNPNNTKRIGSASVDINELTLKNDVWQKVELLAITETDTIQWLNPYFYMKGNCVVDIDDIEAISLDDATTNKP